MTSYDDNFFTPEEVDEQIEHLSRELNRAHRPRTFLSQLLIEHLRLWYRSHTPEEDAQSLERSWQRIAHDSRGVASQQKETGQVIHLPIPPTIPKESKGNMQRDIPGFKQRPTLPQRLGMVAAVAFLTILVGSMAFVLNLAHNNQGNTITGRGHATATPAPHHASPTATVATASHNIGKIVYTSPNQLSEISSVAWTPDSQRIAITGIQNVVVWDATTGHHTVTYTVTPGDGSQGFVPPYAVSFSPDGKRLAASNNYLHIWNTQTTKQLVQYPTQSGQASVSGTVNGALTYTASGNNVVSFAALAPTGKQQPLSGGSPILALAWSPNSQFIAFAMDGGYGNIAVVLNATTGKAITTYRGHSNYINSIVWSPDGQRIATASDDGTVQIWNPLTGHTYVTYRGSGSASAVAWSLDGTRIASSGKNVQVWDPTTGKTLLTYQTGFANRTSALAWSPDGTRIASSGKNVEIWNATTGKTIYTFTGNPQSILTIAWSPNGKYIVSTTGPLETGPVVLQVWIAS